jgi:hypothetical protein
VAIDRSIVAESLRQRVSERGKLPSKRGWLQMGIFSDALTVQFPRAP